MPAMFSMFFQLMLVAARMRVEEEPAWLRPFPKIPGATAFQVPAVAGARADPGAVLAREPEPEPLASARVATKARACSAALDVLRPDFPSCRAACRAGTTIMQGGGSSWKDSGSSGSWNKGNSWQNQEGSVELEFIIWPDGRIEERVRGVKGGDCKALTEEIEKALGEVYQTAPTEEMFEQEVVVEQSDENTVSESWRSGDGTNEW